MPAITITTNAAQAQRVAIALGKAQSLKDTDTPPQPRAATAEEIRQFLIGRLRQLVVDVEGQEAEKARGPAPVAAFDPT